MNSLDELIAAAVGEEGGKKPRLAIAPCAERFVLRAALAAAQRGLVEPVFIGHRERACTLAETLCPNFADFEFVDCADDVEAVTLAVDYFRTGRAQLVMKGLVPTATLLKAVLAKDAGLVAPGGILSLVSARNEEQQSRSQMT